MNKKNKKNIQVPILARVEGEGALDLEIQHNKITRLQLKIYEPPRFFEKFLVGRQPNEVIDAVARICGICPVAYQMSASQAIEQAFDITVDPWVREMRRLFYCGEWIESHTMHIYMLAAPDFLGYDTVIAMAKDHGDFVKRGMQLHHLGIDIMSLLGKRSVNPVGACVGGFYFIPEKNAVAKLLNKVEMGIDLAHDLLLWTTSLPFPNIEHDFTSVSLQHPHEYPLIEGNIVASNGLNIIKDDFKQHFTEHQVPHSTALHSSLSGKSYLAGPLARVNNNRHHLPDKIKTLLKKKNITIPSRNMFHSIIARAIEIYYALSEVKRILTHYQQPSTAATSYVIKQGVGYGCTEAPRGLLWHRYEMSDDGLVASADIIPPTSQNQLRIEEDLRYSLETFGLDKDEHALRQHAEAVIRNYDPCISCSTHFLRLQIQRS